MLELSPESLQLSVEWLATLMSFRGPISWVSFTEREKAAESDPAATGYGHDMCHKHSLQGRDSALSRKDEASISISHLPAKYSMGSISSMSISHLPGELLLFLKSSPIPALHTLSGK